MELWVRKTTEFSAVHGLFCRRLEDNADGNTDNEGLAHEILERSLRVSSNTQLGCLCDAFGFLKKIYGTEKLVLLGLSGAEKSVAINKRRASLR